MEKAYLNSQDAKISEALLDRGLPVATCAY